MQEWRDGGPNRRRDKWGAVLLLRCSNSTASTKRTDARTVDALDDHRIGGQSRFVLDWAEMARFVVEELTKEYGG